MSRNYDYKDQELDLKMRIKFLNKKLREPDLWKWLLMNLLNYR